MNGNVEDPNQRRQFGNEVGSMFVFSEFGVSFSQDHELFSPDKVPGRSTSQSIKDPLSIDELRKNESIDVIDVIPKHDSVPFCTEDLIVGSSSREGVDLEKVLQQDIHVSISDGIDNLNNCFTSVVNSVASLKDREYFVELPTEEESASDKLAIVPFRIDKASEQLCIKRKVSVDEVSGIRKKRLVTFATNRELEVANVEHLGLELSSNMQTQTTQVSKLIQTRKVRKWKRRST